MMYRRLRQRSDISDEDIARLSMRRERAKEPKNGGLTVAEFFVAMEKVTEDNAIHGILKSQRERIKGAAA